MLRESFTSLLDKPIAAYYTLSERLAFCIFYNFRILVHDEPGGAGSVSTPPLAAAFHPDATEPSGKVAGYE